MAFRRVCGIFLLLSIQAAAQSDISFSVCDGATDHLHVSKVVADPYPAKAGQEVNLRVTATTDVDITCAKVHVEAKEFGVPFKQEFDLCSLGVACPISAGMSADATIPVSIPSLAFKGTASSTVTVTTCDGQQLSCINSDISIVKHRDLPEQNV